MVNSLSHANEAIFAESIENNYGLAVLIFPFSGTASAQKHKKLTFSKYLEARPINQQPVEKNDPEKLQSILAIGPNLPALR